MTQDAVSEQQESVEADLGVTAAEAAVIEEALAAQEEAAVTSEAADARLAALQEELALAQAQAQEYLDRLQRTAAEYQNSRRRLDRQLTEAIERANGDLVRRLLPVLDDLDLAFEHASAARGNLAAEAADEGDGAQAAERLAWIEGFRQIQRKLLDLLADHGVTMIDASGEFDPSLHEAVSSEPNDEVESGHIISVLRAGYEYKGQVLRPTLVRVAM